MLPNDISLVNRNSFLTKPRDVTNSRLTLGYKLGSSCQSTECVFTCENVYPRKI